MTKFLAIALTLIAVGSAPALAIAQSSPHMTPHTGTAANNYYQGTR